MPTLDDYNIIRHDRQRTAQKMDLEKTNHTELKKNKLKKSWDHIQNQNQS
tara:strand:+ start:50 stop:199 length:150 start_codon:yes stop_codon:yes gene_type:complete